MIKLTTLYPDHNYGDMEVPYCSLAAAPGTLSVKMKMGGIKIA